MGSRTGWLRRVSSSSAKAGVLTVPVINQTAHSVAARRETICGEGSRLVMGISSRNCGRRPRVGAEGRPAHVARMERQTVFQAAANVNTEAFSGVTVVALCCLRAFLREVALSSGTGGVRQIVVDVV